MSVARADQPQGPCNRLLLQNTSSSELSSISMTSLKVSEPLSQLVEEPLISPKIHKVSLVQIS